MNEDEARSPLTLPAACESEEGVQAVLSGMMLTLCSLRMTILIISKFWRCKTMLNISFQFFAHKKAAAPPRTAVILNRRDSAQSALTVSSFWLATSSFVREARTFIRQQRWYRQGRYAVRSDRRQGQVRAYGQGIARCALSTQNSNFVVKPRTSPGGFYLKRGYRHDILSRVAGRRSANAEPRKSPYFDKPTQVCLMSLRAMALFYLIRNYEYAYGYTRGSCILTIHSRTR